MRMPDDPERRTIPHRFYTMWTRERRLTRGETIIICMLASIMVWIVVCIALFEWLQG